MWNPRTTSVSFGNPSVQNLAFTKMAFPVDELRCVASDIDVVHFENIVASLRSVSLPQVIDLACLDDEDIGSIFPDGVVAGAGKRLRDHAIAYKGGWASLSVLRDKNEEALTAVAEPVQLLPPMAEPGRSSSKTSARALKSACSSFARRMLFGAKVRRNKKKADAKSLEELKDVAMNKALSKIHETFGKYAQDSPRFRCLQQGLKVMVDMQLQSYRMGSRSPRVVAQRARAAEAFLLDFSASGWSVAEATPFQVATWVRSRCIDGTKTAASRCGCTLRLVQWATDWKLHLEHPLVQCQVKPSACASDIKSPWQAALTPSVDVVLAIDGLVVSANTPQLRCIAGFFACLAFGSSRFSDVQESKDVKLTNDAISGMAFMKNKKSWERWFCSRRGLAGDWASAWIKQLSSQGLPGPELVLWAPNSSLDE